MQGERFSICNRLPSYVIDYCMRCSISGFNVIDYIGIIINYSRNLKKKSLIKFELDSKAIIIIFIDFIEFYRPSENKVYEIVVDERITYGSHKVYLCN